MKITRIPDEEDAYQVPTKLVNWLVRSILVALVTIGGYMVVWAISDAAINASFSERINQIEKRLDRDNGNNGP